ncbi:MAG: hypothetical protein OXR66_03445 [Candidatus Woesearchaeota archaeon]|nr:hypothetical protein [Candidatus Woesearchaeota archaeon]
MCSRGRLSIGQVAELLHVSIYDVQERAREKGIELGITVEEYEKGKEIVDKLLR